MPHPHSLFPSAPAPFVRFHRLPHARDLPIPSYATPGAAGMDLRAAVSRPVILPTGRVAKVPTGFQIALPMAWEGQVRSRSGLAREPHRIVVANSPGTVDEDYRGELIVLLANFGNAPFEIGPGDRIAQLVVAPSYQVDAVEWPDDMAHETGRGDGGFGSTGIA